MSVGDAAEAQTVLVYPSLGALVVTSAYQRDCLIYQPQTPCTVRPLTLRPLPSLTVNAPALNGTFTFNQSFGPSSNAGVFVIDGVLEFASGTLLSSKYNFTFVQATPPQQGTTIFHEERATGYVIDLPVRVLGTNQIIYPVPEPATWTLLLLGFAGAGLALRRAPRRVRGRPTLTA